MGEDIPRGVKTERASLRRHWLAWLFPISFLQPKHVNQGPWCHSERRTRHTFPHIRMSSHPQPLSPGSTVFIYLKCTYLKRPPAKCKGLMAEVTTWNTFSERELLWRQPEWEPHRRDDCRSTTTSLTPRSAQNRHLLPRNPLELCVNDREVSLHVRSSHGKGVLSKPLWSEEKEAGK